MSLNDKHIVITGGSGALGRAVVAALVDAGARCYLPGFESAPPDDFDFANHDRVIATWGVDLTNEGMVSEYYAGVDSLWGSVHLAGGFAMKPVTETSVDDLHKMVTLNGVTCFLCCREAVRSMRGTGNGGRIVNVAARPALQATGGMIAYAASKAMVALMTQSLGAELIGDGILVNAVVPSLFDTPGNRAAMPDADHATWPKPEQIADTIGFLVSPVNALTSGALVPVYGRH